ncbi:MAG: response regulator, partial [Bilophila wadsworthia]
MPIMDGLDAARTIRALPREDAASIPIFALSASVFTEDVERSLCSGMNGHLGKPVDIDQICSMLQTWLYPQQTDTQEQA